jgi:two-component system, NtrC family, response regulator GlrR
MDDVTEKLVRDHRNAQTLSRLIGDAPAFRRAIAMATVAAQSDAAVLVSGETGTGKELVAGAIHYLSDRASEPFVSVNCGSLTDSLLEDELFGHERGAFTDARQRRTGVIAQAGRGTLFLDEIDTLTSRGQVALLRVLQDKVYRPLGSQREYKAQVRFVAATNAELAPMMDTGAFRTDLYYRLCVFAIALPPLRERPDDILRLAMHFLAKHMPSNAGGAPTLSRAAETTLLACAWRGNVRELENAMIRAGRLCETSIIEVEHLGLSAPVPPLPLVHRPSLSGNFAILKAQLLRSFEQEYLVHLMRDVRGNVTKAARIAGKDRRDLGKLLKKHGLTGIRA